MAQLNPDLQCDAGSLSKLCHVCFFCELITTFPIISSVIFSRTRPKCCT